MKLCPVTLEDVASLDNLCEAWEEFIRGKRNKEDVQAFTRNLADEIVSLHEDLLSGAYRHGSYIHFRICDPKPRDIHKASVRDRLLHHALHRKLDPFYDRLFIADSFSCRTGKGVHAALDRFRSMAREASRNHTRTCWVLKCDIRKFFASIDHEILLEILAERITDQRLLNLLARIVGSFEVAQGKACPEPFGFAQGRLRRGGIPLGNLTSQLFANVYLNELDQFIKRFLRAEYFIRYADDFIILSSDKERLISFLPLIQLFLRDRLRLLLHPNKVFLQTVGRGVDFLGWCIFHVTAFRGRQRRGGCSNGRG